MFECIFGIFSIVFNQYQKILDICICISAVWNQVKPKGAGDKRFNIGQKRCKFGQKRCKIGSQPRVVVSDVFLIRGFLRIRLMRFKIPVALLHPPQKYENRACANQCCVVALEVFLVGRIFKIWYFHFKISVALLRPSQTFLEGEYGLEKISVALLHRKIFGWKIFQNLVYEFVLDDHQLST